VYLFSSSHFEFSLTPERNDVLAAWSSMPIDNSTGSSAMQFCSSGIYQLEDLVPAACAKLSLHFFGVCLAI
jgi:hypothetical protein